MSSQNDDSLKTEKERKRERERKNTINKTIMFFFIITLLLRYNNVVIATRYVLFYVTLISSTH